VKQIKLSVLENQDLILPFLILDGEESELSLEISLEGEGAKFHLFGIYIGQDMQKLDFKVHIVHRAKHTYSRTHIRCVLFDKSEFNNDGLVVIQKGAKQSNTFYTSRILLFDESKGRSVPSLEIDENDVTGAGHASSLGRPREEELFYLKSRGLSQEESEKLIVRGFFEPILKELTDKDREMVTKKLDEKLGGE
jgi:Fe-S cluster assembly protein SufD